MKVLKLEKLEKVNSVHFVSCTFGENTRKHLFLQNCGLLEALKLERRDKTHRYEKLFSHIIRLPLRGHGLPARSPILQGMVVWVLF